MSELAPRVDLAPAERLSAAEARALTEEVKRDAEALWRKLLELHERGAYLALGYSSWHAYCEAEFGFGQSHSYRLLDAGRVAGAVPQLGNEAQARELVPLLRDEGEAAVVDVMRELHAEHGERLTAEKVRRAVTERLQLEQRIGTVTSSGGVEWYTPARYVEAAREVLGGIDLDPASSMAANATVQAQTFYDAAADGLGRPWFGRVYLNPPYGRDCPKFVARLLASYEAGQVEAAVALLSAYSLDTAWFQPLWDHLLCFVAGRISFDSPIYEHDRPSTGSVFVYLGPDRALFRSVFERFGAVVERSAA